ncbi:MAG TPA: DUF1573 domain-containing protein [Chitinophagales bacterium]|nr:DUF1573 domain-containing protein [Chitinophagales bacterium]HNM32313.1 DUF1573 domain-containing protein [Chitinophagales bacterium]
MSGLKWTNGIVILSVLLFTQCRSKPSAPTISVEKFNHDSILANDKTLKKVDSVRNSTEQSEEERLKTVTSIKFDKEVYDFGTCNEGDKVKKNIEFTNTGKLPLIIEQAYGSCGCTVPTYDKEPVQPGKKGKIEVEFNSANRAGANTKSVMIQANTNPPITTVTFSIKVTPSKNKKSWF